MKIHRKQTRIKAEGGFTLVELMVVIGIMILGATIGIPAYNSTIKPTAELKSASRKLYSDIQQARMLAISKNERYGVAFYTGPDRYVVFIDNNTANGQYDIGEQVVKTINLTDEFGNIAFDSGCGGCSGDGITFSNNAFSMTTRALASTSGTIFLKNLNDEGRSVSVNTMGNVQIAVYTP